MSNPFMEDDDDVITEIEASVSNNVPQTSDKSKSLISWHEIAQQLVTEKFVLTALEFYTEMQERGKDLNFLHNYFSNPSNFEQQIHFKETSSRIFRSGSSSTFDSLEMARFSDDGNQVDEKVAVLEFELRKANDTIKSLRANLTITAEQETSCLVGLNEQNSRENSNYTSNVNNENENEDIKPLELHAINYLVNEYLLQHGYKLSAITLSDESEGQDFEDWHDVGINTPKPPGLLSLYRDYGSHCVPMCSTCDVGTNTEVVDDEIVKEGSDTDCLIEELRREIEILKEKNKSLSNVVESLQKKDIISNEELNDETNQREVKSNENNNNLSEIETDPNEIIGTEMQQYPDENRMTSSFWESLLSETQSASQDTWLNNEVINVCETPSHIVELLAICLPHIVPTVLLAKRDQLVPLLLSAAALHNDVKIRNELLHILFNLIKKPDQYQRQMILRGCVSYAKHVGKTRCEAEILPQFWEQIGHKFVERRQLVAEACGVIAPFLSPEMRSSLLLSILQQMEQEEKLESVRCSLVRSFALIFAFLENEDKYKQSFGILNRFLCDESTVVRECTYTTLLPSFCLWSLHISMLHSFLCENLLKDLQCHVEKLNENANEIKCLRLVEALSYVLPYLFVAVLYDVNDVNFTNYLNENPSPVLSDERFPEFRNTIGNPASILTGNSDFSSLVNYFDEVVCLKDSFEDNPVCRWLLDRLLPRILNNLKKTPPENEEVVSAFSEYLQNFSAIFGTSLLENKVLDLFSHSLESSRDILLTSSVPCYAVLLSLNLDVDSRANLHEFLETTVVELSQNQLSIASVECALKLLRSLQSNHDTIVQVLWSCVMHDSPLVRGSAAALFGVMTTSVVDQVALSSRVLPGLITLATDQFLEVKIATITPLTTVVENPNANFEILERVISQLTEIVSSGVSEAYHEHSRDGTLLGLHSVAMLILQTTIRLAATVHPKFRDEFLLPHLLAIAAGNNNENDKTKRSQISLTLLEAYNNLACCFITSSLLQGSFLPALKCLKLDIEALHPNRVDELNLLQAEVERKLEQGSIASEDSYSSRTVKMPPQVQTETLSQTSNVSSIGSMQFSQAISINADDTKKKILSTWDQIKSKSPASSKFSWNK